MILQLDNNFRIESDEFNYILMKRARTGKKLWRVDGYYKDLGQALVEYSRHKIMETDSQHSTGALNGSQNNHEAF